VVARVDTDTGGLGQRMQPCRTEDLRRWGVRMRVGGAWTTHVLAGWQRAHALTFDARAPQPDAVLVSGVDRLGNESRVARVKIPMRGASSSAP
jgi:hypothetical protein